MAGEALEYLAPINLSFLEQFKGKRDLLSYLILCVAKMPFLPPVSISRSESGRKGKETVSKAKVSRGDKGSSINEQLTTNLKQLGKKIQSRSRLPIAKATPGAELHVKRRDRVAASAKLLPDKLPVACLSGAAKVKAQERTRNQREEEKARFTLTLTPEAVLLLRRRNGERRQRSAARNARDAAEDPQDSRSKKQRPAPAARAKQAETGDLGSIVKISLLNERHKYDDVEYEEERDAAVDQRVLLKCTEWLRGLENAPLTAQKKAKRTAGGMTSF